MVRRVSDRLTGDPALLDEALRQYTKDRDAALMPGYESTLAVARLAPPHEQRLALLRAVQADPELTSIYFDMVAGIGTASALYTPKLLELLTRLMVDIDPLVAAGIQDHPYQPPTWTCSSWQATCSRTPNGSASSRTSANVRCMLARRLVSDHSATGAGEVPFHLVLGGVIAEVVDRPGEAWTIDRLAAATAMSRATFRPPLHRTHRHDRGDPADGDPHDGGRGPADALGPFRRSGGERGGVSLGVGFRAALGNAPAHYRKEAVAR